MTVESNYFKRNHFEEGMLLAASDLSNLQAYGDSKRRLINHAVFGYGIIYGLSVKSLSDAVRLDAGFALDDKGQEIYLPASVTIPLKDLFADYMPTEGRFSLCLEYNEAPSGEAFVLRDTGLRKTVSNRIEEKFVLTAKPLRQEKDICVAVIQLQKKRNGAHSIISVESPVDSFHFSPVWDVLQRKPFRQNSSVVCIGRQGILEARETLYSAEIPHGFGKGEDVSITLSLVSGGEQPGYVITGNPHLFGVPMQIAAKLHLDRGTFVVAVRAEVETTLPVMVHWHATLCPRVHRPVAIHTGQPDFEKESMDKPERILPPIDTSLRLHPPAAALFHGEALQFRFSHNFVDAPCGYRIVEPDGGAIDRGGLYTAPMRSGVFCVEAYLLSSPERSIKAYVYVSEKRPESPCSG